jgi:hypothetical protein
MSVANSLISLSVDSQAAKIADLTAQVDTLTSSVSANATQISLLVAATAQAVTTNSIPNSVGYPYANEETQVLYDDALVPGNYAFRISGAFSSPTGSNNTATLELENTAAGATYLLQISGALNVTTVSYTGFLTYANAGPNPKISIKYNTGDASDWGWASLSIVFYRLSTAPAP